MIEPRQYPVREGEVPSQYKLRRLEKLVIHNLLLVVEVVDRRLPAANGILLGLHLLGQTQLLISQEYELVTRIEKWGSGGLRKWA